MRILSLTVPDSLDWPDRDLKLFLAAKLYEAGALSMSQAAATVQLSRRAFTEIIGQYGVSVINYAAVELETDLRNAEAYLS